MDLQNMDLKGGSLQISTEVIGKIARCAALEVDGVSEVSCGKQNKKVKELLAAASIQPPVTVEMRDGTAELTLNLVVAFGARIPDVYIHCTSFTNGCRSMVAHEISILGRSADRGYQFTFAVLD